IPEVDLIVIDECHHAIPGSEYEQFFSLGVPVIGLTATPFRLDKIGLGAHFGEIIVAARSRELVNQGYIVEPRILCPNKIDIGKLKISRGGEFNIDSPTFQKSLADLCGDMLQEWITHAWGMCTVAFVPSVEFSKQMVAKFQQA